jgi:hypothetical protein
MKKSKKRYALRAVKFSADERESILELVDLHERVILADLWTPEEAFLYHNTNPEYNVYNIAKLSSFEDFLDRKYRMLARFDTFEELESYVTMRYLL